MRSHTVTSMRAAADKLEELQRANKNTLADLALAIERRDELLAEVIYLQKELKQAIAERTPHDYGLLKHEVDHLKQELTEAIKERNKTVADLIKQRDEALAYNQFSQQVAAIRQEPSRLEIAAGIMQGWASNSNMEAIVPGERPAYSALKIADFLIAAAKEAK